MIRSGKIYFTAVTNTKNDNIIQASVTTIKEKTKSCKNTYRQIKQHLTVCLIKIWKKLNCTKYSMKFQLKAHTGGRLDAF